MPDDLKQQRKQNARIHEDCVSQRDAMARQREDMTKQQSGKRPPKDANELAKYILDVTTGDAEKIEAPKKNPHAQALGRAGGLASAKTRNERLSPTKRKAIAKKAAKARWSAKKR